MSKPTDVRIVGAAVYFLPVRTRVPLKFGSETLLNVTCARARVLVRDRNGRTAEGWGETPLSAQWAWPENISLELRERRMRQFCVQLAKDWANFNAFGHAMEIGADFCEHVLPKSLASANAAGDASEKMPRLAALICSSPFDIALHDAYGNLNEVQIYEAYSPEFMNRSLGDFMPAADDDPKTFRNLFPRDLLSREHKLELPAWHLVGGLDLIDKSDLTGNEPNDGYPVVLTDWIRADGLKCLKVKLRGTDADWDFLRMKVVGQIAAAHDVEWLSADFNCTVTDPDYVNGVLDKLRTDEPRTFEKILYVEQPFPYDLETNRIDVRSVVARKPLFLDESAHDWRMVKLGRGLGWNGVALKTCKTQTGAILSAGWAKAHGMSVMVQDLTNPMLAQIPHVLLASRVGTLFGVETNAMQFYPQASEPEAKVHPGLYRRRNGKIDLSTLRGSGFGYRLQEIQRDLPSPAAEFLDS